MSYAEVREMPLDVPSRFADDFKIPDYGILIACAL
jgi:hypothetical protein